jgi:hypothetical protein
MFRPGLAALLLALLAIPAGAEIYKWTDVQGKVHYGDQPPSGSIPRPFNPQTPKAAEARADEARRNAAEQTARKRVEQETALEAERKKQAGSEEETRRKADNCQRARNNLDMLQRMGMRLTTVDVQGRARTLDAAARQAEIDRANQMIAENCPN